MLARRGVGPFADRAWALQSDKQAAARRVADVANQPVAARAAAIGEIMPAHCVRFTRKTARQLGGRARHARVPEKKGPP